MGANEVSRKIVVALAAEELCKEKKLRAVTVPEICARAGLSKTSFYRLFQDKYDIALWILSIPMLKGVGECGRSLTCEQGVAITLQGQALFRTLYLQSVDAGEVIAPDERARVDSTAMLRETIIDFHHLEIDEELEFMIEWLSIAAREIVKLWLKDDRGKDAATVAHWIAGCCPSRLREILDNPVNPGKVEPVDFQRLMLMAME